MCVSSGAAIFLCSFLFLFHVVRAEFSISLVYKWNSQTEIRVSSQESGRGNRTEPANRSPPSRFYFSSLLFIYKQTVICHFFMSLVGIHKFVMEGFRNTIAGRNKAEKPEQKSMTKRWELQMPKHKQCDTGLDFLQRFVALYHMHRCFAYA